MIDRQAIKRTQALIEPHIRRTPVLEVAGRDFGLEDTPVAFKLEFLQHAGSFKTRGAFANLLLRQVPAAGVVAASGGNHGVAVAYASAQLQKSARIFVPEVASPAKITRIRELGAELTIAGARYADALAESETWAAHSGAMQIHAFDQPETLLGQGTVGAELESQVPDLRTLLVAVGGGGLLGGIAAWYGGRVRLIGVEPEAAPTLTRALEAGHPVEAEAGGIAADSLAPRSVGELMFPLAQRFIERVVLVSDAEILAAQHCLWDTLRIVTEPGGAAAFAALLSLAIGRALGSVSAYFCAAATPLPCSFLLHADTPHAQRQPGASDAAAVSPGQGAGEPCLATWLRRCGGAGRQHGARSSL